jgi:hypothetical protein
MVDMDIIFSAVFLIGLAYLAVLISSTKNREQFKYRLRQHLNWDTLLNRFDNKQLRKSFEDIGWSLSSRNVNFIRYVVCLTLPSLQYITDWIRGGSFTFAPLMVALLLLLISSPFPLAPAGLLLKKVFQRKLIKRDGELLSFLRLYENNRLRQAGYKQLWSFCLDVAPHFTYIRKDLILLSDRVNEDGLESGIDWFVAKYPRDHPFIFDFRSILLTTDNMKYEEAVHYLKEQNKVITDISRDQYARRWEFIGDMATIFNALPSAASFLMMISLVLLYVSIIRTNFHW